MAQKGRRDAQSGKSDYARPGGQGRRNNNNKPKRGLRHVKGQQSIADSRAAQTGNDGSGKQGCRSRRGPEGPCA